MDTTDQATSPSKTSPEAAADDSKSAVKEDTKPVRQRQPRRRRNSGPRKDSGAPATDVEKVAEKVTKKSGNNRQRQRKERPNREDRQQPREPREPREREENLSNVLTIGVRLPTN